MGAIGTGTTGAIVIPGDGAAYPVDGEVFPDSGGRELLKLLPPTRPPDRAAHASSGLTIRRPVANATAIVPAAAFVRMASICTSSFSDTAFTTTLLCGKKNVQPALDLEKNVRAG